MAKIFPLLCAALAIDVMNFTDGKAELTEAQAEALENLLADRETEIANLKADLASKDEQIANLQKQPAEDTTDVIDEGSSDEGQEEFTALASRAREMFNAIS